MKCGRVEELIPLYVESDLDQNQSHAISLHLESCQACNGLLNEYRDSQQWMKSQTTAEFSDDFFDEIRRSVLAQVEEKPRISCMQVIINQWRSAPAMALATAILILIGGITLYLYLGKQAANPLKEERANAPAPKQEDQKQDFALKDNEKASEKKEVDRQKKLLPRFRRPDAAVARERKAVDILPQHVREPGMISNSIVSEPSEGADLQKRTDEMTRMEIQTKDPNIRIIWFSPKPDNSRSSKPVTD